MRVLCACEESQAVTSELRRLGHEAYSCDLLPTGGAHPEWHVRADAVEVAKLAWDMVIAFPPCTHLACSGARWFGEKRRDGRQQSAIGLFLALATLDHVPRVAVENPVGIMSRLYRKPDQVIQPWQFGHPETKATCLWLRGLPPLVPTHDVSDEMARLPDAMAHRVHHMAPGPDRQRLRGRTYPGIARAMAEQWTREDGR
ncbi:hypothetical protein ADJ70_03345 [Olsenella sp. oral taxon 807]|uniref:hypothetical protein n=1 Tax=Olsenella sp. oral taxon 807 TaxID=712411 RepID=UPI00067A2F54|nr:hypothetical protein [Olsenella sp. oral taxon 807]AKT48216.1 hypothetical protein ADJ70_03345 [Olsenella sp. oral taxon 807]